jgi:hypothetical protein
MPQAAASSTSSRRSACRHRPTTPGRRDMQKESASSSCTRSPTARVLAGLPGFQALKGDALGAELRQAPDGKRQVMLDRLGLGDFLISRRWTRVNFGDEGIDGIGLAPISPVLHLVHAMGRLFHLVN